jgi:hypothetical protein
MTRPPTNNITYCYEKKKKRKNNKMAVAVKKGKGIK